MRRNRGKCISALLTASIIPLVLLTGCYNKENTRVSRAYYVISEELDVQKTTDKAQEILENAGVTAPREEPDAMYFFLDDNNGWRLMVAEAAAGSRFYVMERTADGGATWEQINENPYNGQAGIAEGLIFFDKSLGFTGLTGASQSYSALYITKDGGISFEKIELPMDTVTELPEFAEECGLTLEDYNYLNMPESDGGILKITVTTDVVETAGIVFQSIDNGTTWEYNGITQKN